jgi:hypothetical protein
MPMRVHAYDVLFINEVAIHRFMSDRNMFITMFSK